MSSPTPTPIGVVAHYNLLEQLEPAGPGDLYRARDTRLGRTVAVRLLPDDYTADRGSLLTTARQESQLSHPNVTAVFDAGEHEGRVYVAFEFHKGQSLRAEAAGRPMNVRRAVGIAVEIADAVATAHAHGCALRGLSPDAVVISAKGKAKISAFALAAQCGFEHNGADARLSDYESPEEARGETADPRSDVYSVGAILYETLTTRRPLHRGASAPSGSNRGVPKQLDPIVLKALAPRPDARFQSAAELAGELRTLLAVLEAPDAAGEEGERSEAVSVGLGRIIAIAGGMLLVVAGVAWWVLGL